MELAKKRKEPTVPVLLVDLSEEEEQLVLATIDPIAGLAVPDAKKLTELLGRLDLSDGPVKSMLADLITEEDLESATEDGGDGEGGASSGSLLELTSVTIGEPKHRVERGEVWQVGKHVLVCFDVLTEWREWVDFLEDDAVFCPYPGPFVPLTMKAREKTMVMVQPDPFIAGHILDQFAAVNGKGAVRKVSEAEK